MKEAASHNIFYAYHTHDLQFSDFILLPGHRKVIVKFSVCLALTKQESILRTEMQELLFVSHSSKYHEKHQE